MAYAMGMVKNFCRHVFETSDETAQIGNMKKELGKLEALLQKVATAYCPDGKLLFFHLFAPSRFRYVTVESLNEKKGGLEKKIEAIEAQILRRKNQTFKGVAMASFGVALVMTALSFCPTVCKGPRQDNACPDLKECPPHPAPACPTVSLTPPPCEPCVQKECPPLSASDCPPCPANVQIVESQPTQKQPIVSVLEGAVLFLTGLMGYLVGHARREK